MKGNKDLLIEIGMNFIRDEVREDKNHSDVLNEIREIFKGLIYGTSNQERDRVRMAELVGSTRSYDLIQEILTLPEKPPTMEAPGNDSALKTKKRQFWSLNEDLRLIAAVYRCGTSSWDNVSNFVGRGRSRIQCLQRWTRVLNPKINKDPWTTEEEKRLVELVENGNEPLSWGQIARKIGSKCDLQCRYKYHKIVAQRTASAPKKVQEETVKETDDEKKTIGGTNLSEFLDKSVNLEVVEAWIETDLAKWD